MICRLVGIALAIALAASAANAQLAGRGAQQRTAEAIAQHNKAVEAFDAKQYQAVIEPATAALDSGKLNSQQTLSMLIMRGLANAQLDRCAAAIPDLTSALETTPEKLTLYRVRSFCRAETGDAAGAAADIEAALQIAPSDPEANREKCALMTTARNWPEAAVSCGVAAEAYPEDVNVQVGSAQAYEQSGEKARAYAGWQKAAQLDPSNQFAKDGIARTKP